MVMIIPCQSALRFELLEPGGLLLACFDPQQSDAAPDHALLMSTLAEQALSVLHFDADAMTEFLHRCTEASNPVSQVIAERRDAHCEISVSEDAMTVWLTLTPAFGGKPTDRSQIQQALQSKGVLFGIDKHAVEQALLQGACVSMVIARGRAATAGKPTTFRSLIPDAKPRGPRANSRGIVDYRDVSTLIIVRSGEPLMRRIPATPGQAGADVFGRIIPAEHGADIPFSSTLQGAAAAEDDPDLLLASITGQPLLQADGVSVQPTITLPQVDMNCGNITFEGSVNITGNVTSGMRVYATGDVFVAGCVEAAEIDAGGCITVLGGVIGNAERTNARGHTMASRARLLAKESITLRFCENLLADAGTDILIEEFSLHSDLTALNQIVIGTSKHGRSQMIGGQARAGSTLQAGTLGSTAGVKTRLQVGYHPHVHAQLAEIQQLIHTNESKQDDLRKILSYTEGACGHDRTNLREKTRRTLDSCEQEHLMLQANLAELQTIQVLSENAHVMISQALHPGVEIQVGSRLWHSNEAMGAGTVKLVDGEVFFESA